jgi:hypothetical protein
MLLQSIEPLSVMPHELSYSASNIPAIPSQGVLAIVHLSHLQHCILPCNAARPLSRTVSCLWETHFHMHLNMLRFVSWVETYLLGLSRLDTHRSRNEELMITNILPRQAGMTHHDSGDFISPVI